MTYSSSCRLLGVLPHTDGRSLCSRSVSAVKGTPRSRRDEYADLTRAALVDGATELFARKGLRGDVARGGRRRRPGHQGARCTTTSAAARRLCSRRSWPARRTGRGRVVSAALASSEDPWTAALAGLDAYLDLCLDPVYARVVLQDVVVALGRRPTAVLEQGVTFGLMRGLLASLVDAGLLRPAAGRDAGPGALRRAVGRRRAPGRDRGPPRSATSTPPSCARCSRACAREASRSARVMLSATRGRVVVLRDALSTQLWPVPTIGITAAVAAGVLLPRLDRRIEAGLPEVLRDVLFGGGADAARTVLNAIGSSLITGDVVDVLAHRHHAAAGEQPVLAAAAADVLPRRRRPPDAGAVPGDLRL